ncbi:MAG: hypothetical protein KIT22_20430, partial [Verrucomicrobiae bacterium]|nr:hypothetical protein [Verrucomicrobiae bacterium]
TLLLAGLERHRAAFRSDPDAASRLLSAGEMPRDPRLAPAEHAAWMLVCSTVLNLDEALTKE